MKRLVVAIMMVVVIATAAMAAETTRTKAPTMRKGTVQTTLKNNVKNAQFQAEMKKAEKSESVVKDFWLGK